ncbi:MAG: hypothetical protein U5N86_07095 [Planctomycetota bacterium]|nr:hypothetical protein [Planctomycetota bacterium]
MSDKLQTPVREHAKVRIKVDEELLEAVKSADSALEMDLDDEKIKRFYEHNCNRRELKLYNLLKQVVGDFNEALSSTRIRMRIIEEGQGLYLEMDI